MTHGANLRSAREQPEGSLPGPSRTITVEPIEVPRELPREEPAPPAEHPAEEPAPAEAPEREPEAEAEPEVVVPLGVKPCADCWNALTFKDAGGRQMARCAKDLWVKASVTVEELNGHRVRRWYADCPEYDDSE